MSKNDNEIIKMYKGADRVRMMPGVIFGSAGIEGAQHTYFEILSNSIDEAKEGNGSVIHTTIHPDGSIEVTDKAGGIPMEWNDNEKRFNWDLIFNELYAGGKFDKSDMYEDSLGLHGLGAASTQYSSESFEVTSIRSDGTYSASFARGIPLMSNGKPLPDNPTKKQVESVMKVKKGKNKDTGTIIKWKLDNTVFTDTEIPVEFFKEVLEQQAIVNDAVTFTLEIKKGYLGSKEDELSEYVYPEGILGYVKELNGDNGMSQPVKFYSEGKGRDRADLDDYLVKATVAFAFNNYTNSTEYFHNSSYLEGGSPDRAVKSAFVAALHAELTNLKKYNAKETKINFNDIEDSLIVVISSFSAKTSYDHQTKKSISNVFIQKFLTDLIKEELRIWIIENKAEAETVLDQVMINKRSRENAEKNRVNVRNKLMKKVNPFSNNVKKFVDCRSKDKNIKELFIVEGDSALGSVKDARDSTFQGIMPVRGKILNCLKASMSKILASEIITDLIKIMGCGIEIPTKSKKASSFDIDKLQWDKIIITTDADVDGFQIRTLILAMLYKLTPTLINEGYVYIAETPLYEITYRDKHNKEAVFFAFDEQEKDDFVKGRKKYRLQRSKGLGENDPQMMWDTTINPETRRLIRVTPESFKKMNHYFELFLGNDLSGRKQYIEDNSDLYMSDLDVD